MACAVDPVISSGEASNFCLIPNSNIEGFPDHAGFTAETLCCLL